MTPPDRCPHERCPLPWWLAIVLVGYILAMLTGAVLVIARILE